MASVSIGELEFLPQRSRATRSTDAFARMVGAPVVLGFRYTEMKPGSYRVHVAWANRPVEFKLELTQKRSRRKLNSPRRVDS